MLFADDQLLIAQDYEDLEYMTRKLIRGKKHGLTNDAYFTFM